MAKTISQYPSSGKKHLVETAKGWSLYSKQSVKKYHNMLLIYLLHGEESFLRSLLDLQLIKKLPAFYTTRKFVTLFTSVCQLSPS